jgi:hypothetical protein
LVLLVWLVGVAVEARIESARVRITCQSERINQLGQRFVDLREQTRQLGAPDRMLPPSTAGLGLEDRVR